MEQGNNFGIGLITPSDTGNVIEDNTFLETRMEYFWLRGSRETSSVET